MPRPDYHAILKVRYGASEGEIRASYRRLVRECHPDLHPGDAAAGERLKLLNEAYEALTKGRASLNNVAPDQGHGRPRYAPRYETRRAWRSSHATQSPPWEPFAYGYAGGDFEQLFALVDELIAELDAGIVLEWRRMRRRFDW